MTARLIRAARLTGNANYALNITGGDAVVAMAICPTPITGISIGGKNFTRVYNNVSSANEGLYWGHASVWYHQLTVPSGSPTVVISAGSGILYSLFVIENGGKVEFSASGVKDNILGGATLTLGIPTAYTKPGSLCLGIMNSTRPEGVYLDLKGTTTTWDRVAGPIHGADGRWIRGEHRKTSSGGAEEYNLGIAYGGLYALTTVISGYDQASFGFAAQMVL